MKVRTEARRNVILEAAVALFKELGYERTSMNELAKRLGGSKATLYGYFASKEELFRAVVKPWPFRIWLRPRPSCRRRTRPPRSRRN